MCTIERSRGMSMMELIVSVALGMLASLVIFQTFTVNEGYRRTTAAGSDALTDGGYALHSIERQLSWAGSGVARTAGVWGCRIAVTRGGTAVLPAASAFPAPFDAFSSTVRIAPVLAADGGSGAPDRLLMISGQNETSNSPVLVWGAPSDTTLSLTSTFGIKPTDLLLAVDPDDATRPCTVVQATGALAAPVAPATLSILANPLTIGGAQHTPATGLAGFSPNTVILNLGAAPRVQAYGIGQDPATGLPNTLLSYDLLAGGQPTALADNIVNLQVLYGVAAAANTDVVTSWVAPTGVWSAATLSDGSTASADRIARLRALRIALVSRSPNYEKTAVSAATVAVFADIAGASETITLAADDQHYRYKTFETIVPLRNMLLAND